MIIEFDCVLNLYEVSVCSVSWLVRRRGRGRAQVRGIWRYALRCKLARNRPNTPQPHFGGEKCSLTCSAVQSEVRW